MHTTVRFALHRCTARPMLSKEQLNAAQGALMGGMCGDAAVRAQLDVMLREMLIYNVRKYWFDARVWCFAVRADLKMALLLSSYLLLECQTDIKED